MSSQCLQHFELVFWADSHFWSGVWNLELVNHSSAVEKRDEHNYVYRFQLPNFFLEWKRRMSVPCGLLIRVGIKVVNQCFVACDEIVEEDQILLMSHQRSFTVLNIHLYLLLSMKVRDPLKQTRVSFKPFLKTIKWSSSQHHTMKQSCAAIIYHLPIVAQRLYSPFACWML